MCHTTVMPHTRPNRAAKPDTHHQWYNNRTSVIQIHMCHGYVTMNLFVSQICEAYRYGCHRSATLIPIGAGGRWHVYLSVSQIFDHQYIHVATLIRVYLTKCMKIVIQSARWQVR